MIGCSVDTPFTLNEFDKATKFGWNLASDFNKEIGTAYDVLLAELGNGMKGIHKRAVFVIDRQGVIRHIWHSEGGSLPNDEELLDVIRKLP